MAKKKPLTDSETSNKKIPEFKPGNKPYLEYDGCVLNADVHWDEVLNELLAGGEALSNVAEYTGVELNTLQQVQAKNFDHLSFRAGARMLTLYYRLNPSQL